MSTTNTVSVLDGWFKEIYAPNYKNLVPEGIRLFKMIDFVSEKNQTGHLYHQPICLG